MTPPPPFKLLDESHRWYHTWRTQMSRKVVELKDPLRARMEHMTKQRRHIHELLVAYERGMTDLVVAMDKESKRRWAKELPVQVGKRCFT